MDKNEMTGPEAGSEPAEPTGPALAAFMSGGLADVAGATIAEVSKLVSNAEAVKLVELEIEGQKLPFMFRRDSNGNLSAVDVLGEADKWRVRPTAAKGIALVTTRASFCDLVDRHKDDGSALFAQVSKAAASVVAVIDYHELDHAPRFGRHRVRYDFPFSDDWIRWTKVDDAPMSQADFAVVVEERFVDLVSPTEDERRAFEPAVQAAFGTPADILTLARGLEVHERSRLKNSVVNQNGTGTLVFESEHVDASGNTLKVPGLFMLGVPMFDGGLPVRVPVRLRYAARGPALSWKFLIYRVEEFVRAAVDAELAAIREKTGLPLFYGSPEGSEVVSFKS